MKKYYGYLLIFLVFLLTLILWLLSFDNFDLLINYPVLSFGKLFGFTGVVFLTFVFILTTRLRFLEDMFGGLDKVYKLHHLLGAISFSSILSHPIFMILNALPNTALARYYIFPSTQLGYTFGVLAIYLFAILIVSTLFIKLPYKIWKFTHNFMGVALFFAAIHVLLIKSDTSNFLPLKLWVLFLMSVALVAYAYIRIFYHFVGPKRSYQVKEMIDKGIITELFLEPLGRPLKFLPGQSVFMRPVKDDFLTDLIDEFWGEKHPFSISSNIHDKVIRLAIKKSGDFTNHLRNINVGTKIDLYGPYGKFSELWLKDEKNAIWIAGGIGVTPFLSMITELDRHAGKNVHFFYSVSEAKEGIYDAEIRSKIKDENSFIYEYYLSQKSSRLSALYVKNKVGDLRSYRIFICGPQGMMYSLSEQFQKLGVASENIVFEDFDLK